MKMLVHALVALILLAGRSAVAREVVVEDGFQGAELGRSLELAYDPDGGVSLDDVRAARLPFAPSEKDVPSFGYRAGVEWARFELVDGRERDREPLALTFAYGQVDDLTIFVDGTPILRAGDQVAANAWTVPVSRMPTAIVPFSAVKREVLVRVAGASSHQIPLTLRTRSAAAESTRRDALAQGAFYGALVAMAAYNLLLAAMTRSRTYAAYVAYLAAYAWMMASLGGLLPVLGCAPWFCNFSNPWTIAAVGLTSGAFAVRLLGLAEESGERRLLRWVTVRAPLVIFTASAVSYVLSLRLALGLTVPWSVAMCWVAVREVKRGSRVAKLFLTAWLTLLVATMLAPLRALGIVPTNGFTVNITQVGGVVEFVLLSLALADRIKQLQEEVVAKGELALANASAALENAERARVASEEALTAREQAMHELEERRRLQGELDRASQQLVQAEHMATLGMLMAGIAHDLRNPLNYVQGAAEQLREAIPGLRSEEGTAREKTVARVEKVVGWVEQGTASMDAISLAMRNQARGGGEAFEAVALREVVNEALLLCRSRTKLCELEVAVEDVTVHADPTGLGQLVMNLVSNAADALGEARATLPAVNPRIRVSARAAGDRCTIAVEDSGTGIPEELRAKILEPFFTTKPRGQGTGLGLAIVQRVVKQHGGELAVGTSRELGGAAFEMSWGAGV